MFKSFIGIFKKSKQQDKEKISKDIIPEGEIEDNDQKQIDEIIKNTQQTVSKNSLFYLSLDILEDDRKIFSETTKEEISKIESVTLWDKYYINLTKWE